MLFFSRCLTVVIMNFILTHLIICSPLHLTVSEALPGIACEQVMTLGLCDLAPDDLIKINDLLDKLSLDKTLRESIHLKKLRPESDVAVAMASRVNLSDGNYVYVIFFGDSFFKGLQEPAQLFVVAHELAHITKDHLLGQIIHNANAQRYLCVSQVLGTMGVGYSAARFFDLSGSCTTKDLAGVFGTVYLSLCQISLVAVGFGLMFARQSQRNEFEADLEAVRATGSINGGIQFLEYVQTRPNSVAPLNFYHQLFSTHPTSEARIKKLYEIGKGLPAKLKNI